MAEGSRTVFVGNLAWNTTDEELAAFMGGGGAVSSATVQCHADSGRSKGWGLVEYRSEQDAVAAIEALNNQDLGGRAVHVRMDRRVIEASGGFTVFVGNLPWSTTDEELKTLFEDYQPYNAHVKTNMAGRSRGFAILRFSSAELGQQAIAAMNGYNIDGRSIQVREDRDRQDRDGGGAASPGAGDGGGGSRSRGGEAARPPPAAAAPAPAPNQAQDHCTVFVGNLAWSTTDDDLFQHFAPIGGVQSAVVQMAPNGRSKGWGLVVFDSPEQAQAAISSLNEVVLHERKLTIRVDRK